MAKFLIALVLGLALTTAYGEAADLHNHFDPVAGWDGSYEQSLPLLPPVPNLSAKCSTDDISTIEAYLSSVGYSPLIETDDKNREHVTNEVLYNLNDNSIIALSIFSNPEKICISFQGVNPKSDGNTFKQFVLGQRMNERSALEDQVEEEKKNHLQEEHDPYQGDQHHAEFKQ